MVELERTVIPKLLQHLQFWKRYVDGTICFVRNVYQEFALSRPNSSHNSIQFAYQIKKENEIYFPGILITLSEQKIETRVYRKSTNTDIYIHRNLYSTALSCGSLSKKISKKSTFTIMIRIFITFANKIFL